MKPEPGADESKDKDFTLIVSLALATALIGVVFILLSLGDSGKSGGTSSPPVSTRHVGSISHLIGPPEKYIVVGVNEQALDEFRDAVVANDEHGKLELAFQGSVFLVPGRTRVRILKRKFTMVRIRILAGRYSGQAGWVSKTAVRLTRSWVRGSVRRSAFAGCGVTC